MTVYMQARFGFASYNSQVSQRDRITSIIEKRTTTSVGAPNTKRLNCWYSILEIGIGLDCVNECCELTTLYTEVTMNKCAYCLKTTESIQDLYLVCSSCNKNVHINCLKTRFIPRVLMGDTFFNFVCQVCNENGEQISRQKLSWFSATVLVLYNLHKKSEGVSRRGYFHWKSHICNFVDKHWDDLFNMSVKRKKSWLGTVAGTLSHFCPTFFLSGTEELKEPGWWRLTYENKTPQQIIEIYTKNQLKKRGGKNRSFDEEFVSLRASMAGESSTPGFEDSNSMDFSSVDSGQEMEGTLSSGCASNSEYLNSDLNKEVYDKISDTESTSVFPELLMNEDQLPDIDMNLDDVFPLDVEGFYRNDFEDFENLLPLMHSGATSAQTNGFIQPAQKQLCKFPMRVLPEEKTLTCLTDKVRKNEAVDKEGKQHETENESYISENVHFQSLFKQTPVELRIPPWGEIEKNNTLKITHPNPAKCVPMSESEELELLSQLRQASRTQEIPGFARRLYRKLCVRHQKRQLGLPVFNLDETFPRKDRDNSLANIFIKPNSRKHCSVDFPILDRFYHISVKQRDKETRQNCSFKNRLMGFSEPECLLSPYTQRQLKPFIRRDYETTPHWLKLLSEIQAKANKNNSRWQPSPRFPLDYCYVKPQHISTVNSLCCEFFYPGIDLSESLQYPDFSCVVLYKKLVVAFAFMVPDSGYNETYITFLFTRPEWRGAGIATFMLYHLIQTCMGKDITLHVSATNPAVILYQKFGFKIEEFILDFYDKYLPVDSKECKHALFLRLSR